jgi:hypothetical protein
VLILRISIFSVFETFSWFGFNAIIVIDLLEIKFEFATRPWEHAFTRYSYGSVLLSVTTLVALQFGIYSFFCLSAGRVNKEMGISV